jgi:energy-coupling factor transporter ATP-binding protein EcfA2
MELEIVKEPKVGQKVVRGKDWQWGDQDGGSIYGIIVSIDGNIGWCSVEWIDENLNPLRKNGYRVGPHDHDLYYYKEKEQSFTKTKTEEKMSNTSTGLGFQVNIPEAAIQERVDKLVMYKLRHEKIQGVLTEVISSERTKLEIELKKELLAKVKADFEDKKDKIIDSFIESKRTSIFLDDKLKAVIDNPTAHVELPKLISYLQLFKQAMIVGPTGSGKSTLAKQAAESLQMRYGSFSCNMEASKSELVGFANLQGYVTSQFLDFYENGGLFLVDEYDAMSPSIAVVLNAAFDRTGQISVPNRQENPIAKKHKDFYCILAGNTWGSGSVEYQGREMQDMAFLDRFKLCRIFIDYDKNIEKAIAGSHYPWFLKIRKFLDKNVDSEKFSTRSIHDASLLLFNNFSKQHILEMATHHWDEALRKKLIEEVGVA